MSALTVVLLVCSVAAGVISGKIESEESSSSYRLPNSTIPKHYDIKLWTNAYEGNVSFHGMVKIFVEVVEPTKEVILHARNLTINEFRIFRNEENGDRVELSGLKLEKVDEHEQLKIVSSDLIDTGSHTLQMQFNGTVNVTKARGLFLTSFSDGNDTKRFTLASHFEPVRARRAFPCFDEPALKTTFNLSVVHHKNHEAYSNMPLMERKVVEGNIVESSFQQTPMMSTYLLVICTTDLEVKTVGNQFAITRSSLMGKAEDSLQISQNALDFMDKYTNLSYSDYMPKLGHLAIELHKKMFYTAMENWGLIVYAEGQFIDFPKYHNLFAVNVDNPIETIAHEVAHQWFGNLVSPQWWNHIWLNEGFATFYEYYILDQIRPNERWMDRLLIHRMHAALKDDDFMVPISFECNNSENITDQFGVSTYDKAAGFLNMFHNVLGDEKWQKAMQIYLKSQLLNSSTSDDLYAAIEAVSEDSEFFPPTHSVKEIFDSWISQEGSVVLTVKRLEGSNEIILFQQRHQYCAEFGHEIRIIPFNYAYESSPNFEEIGPIHWLTSKAARISTNASYDEWIIFNKDRFGMYKINYDPHNWRLISQALHKNVSSIPHRNRAQLLDDALDSYKEERIYFDVVFQLVTYLRNETDLMVWSRGREILHFIRDNVQGKDNFNLYKTFQTHLIEPTYEALQHQKKFPIITEPIRRWITNMACLGGIQHCLQTAQHAFSTAVETNTPVAPEEIFTVYCFGLKNSSDDQFNWVLSRFNTTRDSKEQYLLVSVLLYCTDGVDRTRKVFAAISDYFKQDADRSADEGMRSLNARFRLVEGKFQQVYEILSEDSEFVDNLGAPVIKLSMYLMHALLKTEEESLQVKTLLKRFSKLFGDDENYSEQNYGSKKPNHDSVAIEYFLKKYVSELK